jgi:phosphate transport system substrate-binding protein
MTHGYTYMIGLVFAAFCIQLFGCSSPPMERMVIKGSTTMAPMLERLAADYQKPGHEQILIESIGSMAGITALIQNTCDMAASSVPASAELIREAEKNGVTLKAFPVCRDRIVPIVNAANPLHQLSVTDLKHIFSGQMSSWKSTGWTDSTIQVVLRQTESGTCRMWEQMILENASPATGYTQVFSNSGVLAAVAENRYAIGYVSNAYLNHEVKALQISGNDNGTCLERTLFLYVNTGRMSKAVKSFLTFLHSGPARQIITDSGFVPITHKN